MKIKELTESTTAGAVASVAIPMGGVQKRAGSIFKGKKTKKKFYEGEMKRIATDMDELSDVAFKKKYGKTKEEMRKGLREEEIIEADLILMPGQLRGKDKSFTPHDKDRRDHEVEMARSELYAAAKDAQRIYKMIQDRTEDEGLMGWQQSYITLASDYLNSVADSLEHRNATEGAGVIAGGMSNFEEASDISGLMAASKLNKSFIVTAKTAEGKTKKFRVKAQSENVAKEVFKKHHSMAEIIDVKDEDLSEAKKDACYNKVKSRYKVWPSAYASGALVKCRKVGASNWGNKSK
jgi:hypothetical protein